MPTQPDAGGSAGRGDRAPQQDRTKARAPEPLNTRFLRRVRASCGSGPQHPTCPSFVHLATYLTGVQQEVHCSAQHQEEEAPAQKSLVQERFLKSSRRVRAPAPCLATPTKPLGAPRCPKPASTHRWHSTGATRKGASQGCLTAYCELRWS